MFSRRTARISRPIKRPLIFESLEERRVLSATVLETPVEAVQVATSLKTPKDVLPAEIPTLTYQRFHELGVEQIPLLTPAQVGTIPDIGWFDTLSAEQRAALTLSQVQALRIGPVRLTHLTPTQISWLTASQIQSAMYFDFKFLLPSQIPYLTTAQIAGTPADFTFRVEMSAAARGALTQTQVQALPIGGDAFRIDWLSPTQSSWLTATQIGGVMPYDFYLLTPSQIPALTTSQIASVVDDWTFRVSLSTQAQAALTQPQVQALNADQVRIDWLTPTQVGWLTVPQIQKVILPDIHVLNAAQTPSLTLAQIAQIPDNYSFGLWSAAARAALTQAQVQVLRVNNIQLDLLTSTQAGWLTPTQVASLPLYNFRYLPPALVPFLTPAQIATIPDNGVLATWTSAAIAALTMPQVQALNIPTIRIDILPAQQIGYLSLSQLRSLPFNDLQFLNPAQIPLLSPEQIASIPDPGPFTLWSVAARAALTMPQVQALNVANVRINLLTPQQISWLSVSQIQSLQLTDIALLAPEQIPFVSPEQFAMMPDLFLFGGWSDEVKSRLTREQLMALPFDVLSTYMKVELSQMPPGDYHPTLHRTIGPDGLPVNAHTIAPEVFKLVPLAGATHVTVASGDWSNPAIWRNGLVPSAGAKVAIGAGHSVRYNVVMAPSQAIKSLRIDGTLSFATNVDTTLRVDTIVVHTGGRLHIGTAAAPVADNATARVIIPDGGPIDAAWDPYLYSRGLLSRGEIRMFGRAVTPYATLSVDPLAGATTLRLTQPPVGWRVGDELVLAGTDPVSADFGSERVRIAGINGTVVTLDRALTYAHDAPDGYGFTIQVANLNRNVQFIAEDPSVVQERPHIELFDNPNVDIENVQILGFGRTDSDKAINSPVVVGGVKQPGTGANPRGRYALHFHHTGVNPAVAPGIVRGSVLIGSPGWGYVNHQSHVVMENNVALDVLGAAFITADGNEIGVMRGNLALNSTGSGDFILSRRNNHDFGHGGHGFWLQGPGVELIDNIAAGARGGAFAYMTASSMTLFDAVNLLDPSIAMGHDAIPVGTVPLRTFRGNTAYAADQGLEIWFHQTNLNDGNSLIENFTSWNTKMFGIQAPYSGHITVSDSTLIGRLNAVSGYGVMTNRLTHDVFLDNLRVEGFEVGVLAPPRRETIIQGGRLANVQNLVINKGHDTLRSLQVIEPITFVPLALAQINGRPTYNVSTAAPPAMANNLDRDPDSLFSDDDIRIALSDGTTVRLYFAEQAGGAIPFPTAPVPAIADFPPEYIGKTNLQLWQSHGVWFNGGELPAGAFTPSGFLGLGVIESAAPTADFDSDGDADGADFLTWQRGLGMPAPLVTRAKGDADGDLDVDAADLAAWKNGYAAGSNGAAATAAMSNDATGLPGMAMAYSMSKASLAGSAVLFVEKQKRNPEAPVLEQSHHESFGEPHHEAHSAALLTAIECDSRSSTSPSEFTVLTSELDDEELDAIFDKLGQFDQ